MLAFSTNQRSVHEHICGSIDSFMSVKEKCSMHCFYRMSKNALILFQWYQNIFTD